MSGGVTRDGGALVGAGSVFYTNSASSDLSLGRASDTVAVDRLAAEVQHAATSLTAGWHPPSIILTIISFTFVYFQLAALKMRSTQAWSGFVPLRMRTLKFVYWMLIVRLIFWTALW